MYMKSQSPRMTKINKLKKKKKNHLKKSELTESPRAHIIISE